MEKIEQIFNVGRNPLEYAEISFKEIQKHIEEKGWRTNINLNNIKLEPSIIKNFSWTRTKKFNRRLKHMNTKKTIRSLNSGFNYLFKRLMEIDNPVKIKVSEKEELIQTKRKKWKEARDVSDKLLLEYKKEKGNFYKM